ncbi:Golgi resident protein GCP60 [Cichlidogyrus casuarinus]|uniref:Golgi resident protein GCP60 n=1 Tax=Cichlidogyrus casuarinus TaxID=1844966 RepID=A0ABD2PQ75_9PLAT
MDTEVANHPEIISNLSTDMSKVSLLADKDDSNLTSEELARHLDIDNLSQQLLEEYRRYAAEEFPKDPEKLLDLAQSEETVDNTQEMKMMPLIPARIWTRPEIVTFKQEILTTSKECCIKIGSLSTATISVPTHADGATVWWEFATDSYDLGFGLFFEWSTNPSDQIVVTISDSDDEEEEGENDDVENGIDESGSEEENANSQEVAFSGDMESGAGKRRRRRHSSELPVDELIPIIRRDCHLQVYCGQHQYPGQGRYLFKFDNSFSLIRSKWLYYRVYYSKE